MKNNNQKKERKIYLVAIAACACMVAGLGGMTLAKYVTDSGTKSNNATVAKWGYVINLDPTNLFGEQYDTNGIVTTNNSVAVVASSTTGKNKVAPGTTGSMTFSVVGQAEVTSKLSFVATGTDVAYVVTGEDSVYNPIKWTLTETDNSSGTATVTNHVTSGLLSDVVAKLNSESVDVIQENTKVDSSYTLTWNWAFSGQDDEKDTYLGNIASGVADAVTAPSGKTYDSDKTSTQVSFSLQIKVEQIKVEQIQAE